MNLKDFQNKNKDKVLVFIKSRLNENDTSGFLRDIESFNISDLNLPLIYTGEPSKQLKWRNLYMKKVDELVQLLHSIATENNWIWSEPLINTNENETILEWWSQSKKITIYINKDTIDYIKVWGADIKNEMEDGVITSDADLKNIWEWLSN